MRDRIGDILDRWGQTAVRLMDLRHDWILRQLESQDWATVARISGVEVPALQARFGPLVAAHPPEARPKREAAGQVDEFKLWKVLQAERSTPAGLALWLTWQMGLSAREIVDLTWDQVSLEDGTVRRAACMGGMLSMLGGECHLLATTFEWADAIDAERAARSKARAEALLAQKNLDKRDMQLAEARLRRALVRSSVAARKDI